MLRKFKIIINLLEAARKDSRVEKLYKGCQTLFSPLMERPKYLLIGFNPGGGYYKWHGKIVEEFEPMQALEYYLNKHPLGEQTKALFEMAGKERDLKNSTVKINFYPWATNNVDDFNQLMSLLPKNLSSQLFELARVWTKNIIEILKPSTIVCEGFKAFDEVEVLFPPAFRNSGNEPYRYFETENGHNVIGYQRNQSSIVNKEKISNFLNGK